MNPADVVDGYIRPKVESTKRLWKQALHGCKVWPVKSNHCMGVRCGQ